MKCPNCNNENDENNKFCVFCGSPLTQGKKEETPVEEVPIEETVVEQPVVEESQESQPVIEQTSSQSQPIVDNAEVSQQPNNYSAAPNNVGPATKQGQRRSLITVLILIVAVVLLALIAIVLLTGGPEKLYKTAVKNGIEGVLLNDALEAKKGEARVAVIVSSNDEAYEMFDGLSVDADVQYDLTNEQVIVSANADSSSSSILKLNALIDLANEKVLLNEENIFSKTVQIDVPEENVQEIKDVIDLDTLKEKDTLKERKQLASTFVKAVNSNLKSGKFTKKKVTISVDDKDKKVTDNILSLTPSQLKEFLNRFTQVLEDDDNFASNMNVFVGEDFDVEDFISSIKDMADRLPDEDEEQEGQGIEFHYYTIGSSKFAGFAALVTDRGDIVTAFEAMMVSKDTYKVTMKNSIGEETELFTVKVNNMIENGADLEFDLSSIGIPANVRVVFGLNKKSSIDKFDNSNVVNVEDLTEDDYEEIYTNLESSPLYTLIEMLDNGYDFDDSDLDFDYDYEEDVYDPDNDPIQAQLGVGEGYVKINEEEILVYRIPTPFTDDDYNTEYYKSYDKDMDDGLGNVSVSVHYGDAKQAAEDQRDKDYLYEDPEFYYNINIPELTTKTINGKQYYYSVVDYDFGSSNLHSHYETYTYQIDDDYYIMLSVDNSDGVIADEDIETFLDWRIQ